MAVPREDSQTLAVFIDFENLAMGFAKKPIEFDIGRVMARLVEKGNIVFKRAYADWKRFTSYIDAMHQSAVELIEIPRRGLTGKNSADMRLCVDALDLCYSKPHITTFVILSGDSDFSPLVSKLKENAKRVIGLSLRASTSDLLRDNCDEFIFYEDLEAEQAKNVVSLQVAGEKEREVFGLLLESLEALRRENRDTLWSSLIKETMKRKRPSFNEAAYGYTSFSRLLEDASRRGLVALKRDAADRSYIVTQFGDDLKKEVNGKAIAEKSKPANTEKPRAEKPSERVEKEEKRADEVLESPSVKSDAQPTEEPPVSVLPSTEKANEKARSDKPAGTSRPVRAAPESRAKETAEESVPAELAKEDTEKASQQGTSKDSAKPSRTRRRRPRKRAGSSTKPPVDPPGTKQ